MIRKILFLAVLGAGLYFVLSSQQYAGVPSLLLFGYLLFRAAPGVGRDLSKVWAVLRGRRKVSTILYSRGSWM